MHLLPMYVDAPQADLKRTEHLAKCVINLPSSVKLGLPYA